MSKEEKLSILSQLISFAQADKNMNENEYRFLLAIANQIDISQKEFDKLFENPAPYISLHPETERIVQFHRLLLLMNIDQNINNQELEKLHLLGLKMGLNIQAIDKTLEVMQQYENNIIPSEVLLNIFKTYYN